MLVQLDLCRACSKTALLVFPQGDSNVLVKNQESGRETSSLKQEFYLEFKVLIDTDWLKLISWLSVHSSSRWTVSTFDVCSMDYIKTIFNLSQRCEKFRLSGFLTGRTQSELYSHGARGQRQRLGTLGFGST